MGLGGGVGGGAADVPGLVGWVGADDEEVGRGGEAAVAGAGGEDGDVAGADDDLAAGGLAGCGVGVGWAAEDEVRGAGGEAEDLVGGGVEVVEVVDAVAPLRGPAVLLEGALHDGGEVGGVWIKRLAVEQYRQRGVVGNPAVAGEVEGFRRGGLDGGEGVGGACGCGGGEELVEVAAVHVNSMCGGGISDK